MIRYLSNILSEEISLTPSASGGLIRLAIKDELGPFKPIDKLDLEDYKNSIEHALKERLQKLGVSNIDKIINHVINELVQHQSLITMEST